MKRSYLSAIIFTATVFQSCVKDPSSLASNQMFSAKIKDKSLTATDIIADNAQYVIILQALPGVNIQDGREVQVSVTDGTILSEASLNTSTAATAQAKGVVYNGMATFYYRPGKKAVPSAILSAAISGLTQSFDYTIKPSEPDKLRLDFSPLLPKVGDNVSIIVYLEKSTGQVSTGLKIDFALSKVNILEEITGKVTAPEYAYTEESNGFIVAKTAIVTNGKPGKLKIEAKYTGNNKSIDTVITYIP